MYLYDLKVNSAYRKCGAAKALIEKAKTIAKEKGYTGIYTQGQHNNLGAFLTIGIPIAFLKKQESRFEKQKLYFRDFFVP